MLVFHTLYTMSYLYGFSFALDLVRFFSPGIPIVAGSFLVIAGISSDLSHSNLIRGLKLLGISIGITLVTVLLFPDLSIWFGMLHLMACCMLLFSLLEPLLRHIPTWVGVLLSALLFACTYSIGSGVFGIPGLFTVQIPHELYELNWLFPIGIPAPGFSSADYFPLLPWSFLFFLGTYLGRYAKAGKFPQFMYKRRLLPFSWLGRHALIIYVLHQPVIYSLLWVLTQIFPSLAH